MMYILHSRLVFEGYIWDSWSLFIYLLFFYLFSFIYLFFSCLGKEAESDLGKCEERYGDVSIHTSFMKTNTVKRFLFTVSKFAFL